MSSRHILINFINPDRDRDPLDLLKIEQEEWAPYTGYVTKANVVKYLAELLYGSGDEVQVDCGMVGDTVVCGVFAYPLEPDLTYQLHTSWGELSERSVEEIEHEEIINVTLRRNDDTDQVYSEESLTYPALEILSTEWLGDTYGADGAYIAPPVITTDGATLQIGAACYGAVRVRYRVLRHTYILNIARREESIQNHFSAVVFGVYSGGINWLEIDPPPGAEEYAADLECGWGNHGVVEPEEDDPLEDPPMRHANRRQVKDYCSQEITSDVTYAY